MPDSRRRIPGGTPAALESTTAPRGEPALVKQLGAALAAQPSALTAALTHAPVPVLAVRFGTVFFANPAFEAAVGAARGTLGSRPLAELLARESVAETYRALDECLAAPGRYVELRCRRVDGGLEAFVASLAAFESESGPWVLAICAPLASPSVAGTTDDGVGPTANGVAASRATVARELPGLTDAELALLSTREREVVSVFARGNRVSAIARELHISPFTVRNHLKAVFRKLAVNSQVALLARLSRR